MKLPRYCTFGCVLNSMQTRCFAARTAKWATTSVNSILYSSAVMTGFKVIKQINRIKQTSHPTWIDWGSHIRVDVTDAAWWLAEAIWLHPRAQRGQCHNPDDGTGKG